MVFHWSLSDTKFPQVSRTIPSILTDSRIIIIIIHSLELFTSALADVFFTRILSDSKSLLKSPQVSRTLLSILAVLNNAVVWMVFTRPPTSKSSSPFSNPLVTCSKRTNYNWYILSPACSTVFQFPSKVEVLILLFHILSVLFCGQPGQQSRVFCKFSFFLLLLIILSLVFWPGLGDPFVC